jgi:hypothetical protein
MLVVVIVAAAAAAAAAAAGGGSGAMALGRALAIVLVLLCSPFFRRGGFCLFLLCSLRLEFREEAGGESEHGGYYWRRGGRDL